MSLVLTTSALAFDCTNVSKSNPANGTQVMINFTTGQVTVLTEGLARRIEQGLVDPVTGAGYHGLVGLDIDGDGAADFSTWAGAGPDGMEPPENAQLNGPACRGLTSIGLYLSECLGA